MNGRLSVVRRQGAASGKVVHGRVELDGELPEGSSVTVIAADDDAFEADPATEKMLLDASISWCILSFSSGYGMFKAGVIGNAGLVVYGAVVGFTPIVLAAVASRFFKPELLRPISVPSLPRF